MAVKTEAVSRPRKRTKAPWRRRIKIVFGLVFVIGVGGLSYAFVYWNNLLQDASRKTDNIHQIMIQVSTRPTEIRSADGKVLFTIATEFRKPVTIEKVPDLVKMTTLAAEDKRFYEHSGVDLRSVLRALTTNVKEGQVSQGASTLEMQLAKRLYSDSSRTFERKLKDMALSVKMQEKLTKDQILELYLNQVYYGEGAYGIQAAADVYFAKNLDQLTLAEAALLARLVRRPSQDNPFKSPERALNNRNVVLKIMLEDGTVTSDQYEKAVKEKLALRKHRKNERVVGRKIAPYYVDYVLEQLQEELPTCDLRKGGHQVETTLDMRMQKEAEEEARRIVKENRKISTAAFVLIDREGQIKAMVGGVDYDRNQFNMVFQGKRQPGSSFKPYVYATALEIGAMGPTDTVSNERFVLDNPDGGRAWAPKNSNGKYGGRYSIGDALAYSINICAVRATEKVGPENVVRFAHDNFGIRNRLNGYMSIGLGTSEVSPLEMAEGYSVFMLGGDRIRPFGIKRVIGPDGSVLLENKPVKRRGVIGKDTARVMDGFLRRVVTRGTARYAQMVTNARGKTGTTQDNKDAWFCGYTDEFVGIGWVADERPKPGGNGWIYKPMPGVFGGTVTVKMWSRIVSAAQRWVGEVPRKLEEGPGGRGKSPDEEEVTPPEEEVPEESSEVKLWPEENPNDPASTPGTPETPAEKADSKEPASKAGEEGDKAKGNPEPDPKSRGRPANELPNREAIVEICAETGLVANIYCPERVPRSFKRGRAPKRSCSKHGL